MKKKFFGKVCAAAVALSCIFNASVVPSLVTAETGVKYEFEDGSHPNSVVPEEGSERWLDGASGNQFVFLENAGETASVNVNVDKTGMYDVIIGFSAPYGQKIHNLYVNGVNQGQLGFPETTSWDELNAGTVKLSAGDNVIAVESSWGWTNLDYLRIEEAVLPDVTAKDTKCSDPQATESTQRLMKYLSDTYGNYIISGQQEYYGTSREDEFNYIKDKTGKLPAIKGFDFGETCPLYYWDAQTAERAIDWVNNKGGIATASWHINVPVTMSEYTLGSTMDFSKTTYSEKTDFVTANVMIEGTVEHDYFLLAVENLAKSLKKCQDADVPILFRPFHEAEGNGGADGAGAWFWWSKEGATTYVQLYRYLYDLLTEEYGLHNLIWEFHSYVYSDDSALWYPGAEYVDLIGYDKYNAKDWSTGNVAPNESAISSTFYGLLKMYDSSKMIALMECDTIPSIQNMIDESAYWLYFCPWYGEHIMDTNYNNPETLKEIYQSEYCITLDELPDLKNYPMEGVDPTDPETTEPTQETTEPVTEATTEVTTETTAETTTTPSSDTTTTVPATDATDVTTSATEPSENVVPSGVEATRYGDVNMDGDVNIADVVALNMYLLNPEVNKISDVAMANSDCVKDGVINTSDSLTLMNFVAMIIDESQLGK